MNRRKFVQTAVLGGTAYWVGGDALAQEPARPEADDPAILAQALFDFAKNRFGQHLTEEELKLMAPRLLRNLGNAHFLSRVPLENGDEPDFVFSAD